MSDLRRFDGHSFPNSRICSLGFVVGGIGLGGKRSKHLKIYETLELGRISFSTVVLRLNLLKIDSLSFLLLLMKRLGQLNLGGSLCFPLPGVILIDLEVAHSLLLRS